MSQDETMSVAKARDAVHEAEEKVRFARRDFMKIFGFGGAALAASSAWARPAADTTGDLSAHQPNANESPYSYAWKWAPGLLYMQLGTTGASPQVVINDFNDNYQDIARNPTAYFFGQQGWRNAIAQGFGCDPYEIVMSFNTSDGLFRIAGGLEWRQGDELITTNMEESAGIAVYEWLKDRYGVVVKKAAVPTNDAYSDAEMLKRFQALLTANTKAILFSSPIYLTGTRLPEKEICAWAASKGIVSIVDGAHLPGMIALNLHDMGCDFMSGAGHKWHCGPGQTGFMYVRNGYNPHPYIRKAETSDAGFLGAPGPTVDVPVPAYSNITPLPKFYPTNSFLYGAENGCKVLLHGNRSPDDNVAAQLQLVGNGSRPTQHALFQLCQLWDSWGRKNIENYLVSVAQYLRANLVDIWGPKALSFPYSPSGSHFSTIGLTAFNPFSPGFDYNAELTPAQASAQATAASNAVAVMKNDYKVVFRTNTVPYSLRSDPTKAATAQSTPIRISTHLFHSMGDVDRAIDTLLAVVPHP
jgi:selenocysteine lyase/cysteine desulfurase